MIFRKLIKSLFVAATFAASLCAFAVPSNATDYDDYSREVSDNPQDEFMQNDELIINKILSAYICYCDVEQGLLVERFNRLYGELIPMLEPGILDKSIVGIFYSIFKLVVEREGGYVVTDYYKDIIKNIAEEKTSYYRRKKNIELSTPNNYDSDKLFLLNLAKIISLEIKFNGHKFSNGNHSNNQGEIFPVDQYDDYLTSIEGNLCEFKFRKYNENRTLKVFESYFNEDTLGLKKLENEEEPLIISWETQEAQLQYVPFFRYVTNVLNSYEIMRESTFAPLWQYHLQYATSVIMSPEFSERYLGDNIANSAIPFKLAAAFYQKYHEAENGTDDEKISIENATNLILFGSFWGVDQETAMSPAELKIARCILVDYWHVERKNFAESEVGECFKNFVSVKMGYTGCGGHNDRAALLALSSSFDDDQYYWQDVMDYMHRDDPQSCPSSAMVREYADFCDNYINRQFD